MTPNIMDSKTSVSMLFFSTLGALALGGVAGLVVAAAGFGAGLFCFFGWAI
jgi:hypothetical protein